MSVRARILHMKMDRTHREATRELKKAGRYKAKYQAHLIVANRLIGEWDKLFEEWCEERRRDYENISNR